jgi:hypothetical protein
MSDKRDCGAGGFECVFGPIRVGYGEALHHGGRHGLDQIYTLLETETREDSNCSSLRSQNLRSSVATGFTARAARAMGATSCPIRPTSTSASGLGTSVR